MHASSRLSLIDESGERYVPHGQSPPRWAANAVNGVAELHSELLKQDVMRGLSRSSGRHKFLQQDERRHAAPLASRLAKPAPSPHSSPKRLARGWLTNLERLREIEPFVNDAQFPHALGREIKAL